MPPKRPQSQSKSIQSVKPVKAMAIQKNKRTRSSTRRRRGASSEELSSSSSSDDSATESCSSCEEARPAARKVHRREVETGRQQIGRQRKVAATKPPAAISLDTPERGADSRYETILEDKGRSPDSVVSVHLPSPSAKMVSPIASPNSTSAVMKISSAQKINMLTAMIQGFTHTAAFPSQPMNDNVLPCDDSSVSISRTCRPTRPGDLLPYVECESLRDETWTVSVTNVADTPIPSLSSDIFIISPTFENEEGSATTDLVKAWIATQGSRPLADMGNRTALNDFAAAFVLRTRQAASDPKLAGQSWYAKHPFPLFPNSDHANAVDRFVAWVTSWSDDAISKDPPLVEPTAVAALVEKIRPQQDDDDDEIDLRTLNLSRRNRMKPLAAESERWSLTPIPDNVPTYDQFGVRLSRRLYERDMREHELAEAALSKSKGYFQSAQNGNTLQRQRSVTSNIAVLSGPHGVGKTGLVFEIAERSHCYVVDVHTGIHRSAANLERLFREATQARRLGATKQEGNAMLNRVHEMLTKMDRAVGEESTKKAREQEAARKEAEAKSKTKAKGSAPLTKEALTNFFAPKPKRKAQESTPIAVDVSPSRVPTPPPPRAEPILAEQQAAGPELRPLVLVDSGDVTFSDESGFLPALRKIAENSKCPVIVTSNKYFSNAELQDSFGSVVPQFRLTCPPEYLLVFYLATVARVELNDDISISSIVDFVRAQPKHRASDARALLSDLQWHLTRLRTEALATITPSHVSSQSMSRQLSPSLRAVIEATALNNALQIAQSRRYFSVIEAQCQIDPDGCADEGDVDVQPNFFDFAAAEWQRRAFGTMEDDWHANRPISTPTGEVWAIANLGDTRCRFDVDAWTLGLGERRERDALYRAIAERHPKRNMKFWQHATEGEAALIDFAPLKALP
jgi:hypothetical protein